MCSKPVAAVTSCKGCLKELCRKHFNEHRDTLSEDLQKVFGRRNSIVEDLKVKIDRASKPTENDKARVILKQIDEWEETTKKRVSETANEARAHVERLFTRKLELDQLQQKIGKITAELQEQQESESFVETDIDHWIKQLEELKSDINRPSEAEISPPVLQIQNIDWNNVITVSSPPVASPKKPGIIFVLSFPKTSVQE
jgi:chromosome segregation ATPase